MEHYRNTQIGYLVLAALAAVVALGVAIYLLDRDGELGAAFVVPLAAVTVALASFATLRVVVDDRRVRVKFGYGIFRKSFRHDEIVSVRRVRNHWYYGWGIRYWFVPRMWIYNVSGLDAVELGLRNGGVHRIGTDAPEELEAAILEVVGLVGQHP